MIARRANALSATQQRETALALTTEAIERLADLGDDPGLVDLLAQHSRFLYLLNRRSEAVEVADRVLPIAERLDMLPVVAELLVTRGTALSSIGREYEGIAVLEGGLKLATANGLTATELRARINLSGLLTQYDPRGAFSIAATGVDMAMRLGLKAYAAPLMGNAATGAIEIGHWDEMIAQLDTAVQTAGVSEDATAQYEYHLDQFAAMRGGGATALTARVRDYMLKRIAAGDTSFEPGLHYLDAVHDQAAGDDAGAYQHCMAAAPDDGFNAPGTYAWAIDLAATMGDAARLQAAIAGLRATGSRAPFSRLALRFGDAALDALMGRRQEALAGFREVLATSTALGSVWNRAVRGLAIGRLLGVDEPEARRALDDARETFERLGARTFVERVDAPLTSSAGTTEIRPARSGAPAPVRGGAD